jgi:signal peptide peptidase SppA
MTQYSRIIRAFNASAWAILPEKLEEIVAFLEMKSQGVSISDATLAEMRSSFEAATMRSVGRSTGAVQVIPLLGTISHRANMMASFSGGTSVDKFSSSLRQAVDDPNIKAIVIDVDSPGGAVDGVPELADQLYSMRGKKPITAFANTLMASAAYWIAAAADEIVASPSAKVGSIGVFATHIDQSQAIENEGVKVTLISAGKYKTEGNPYEPLSTEAKDNLQGMIDEMYGSFVKSVAKGRNITPSAVRDGYGQGRVLIAGSALKSGMVDRVETMDQLLARHGVTSSRGTVRAESAPEVIAATTEEVVLTAEQVEQQTAAEIEEEQFRERMRLELA